MKTQIGQLATSIHELKSQGSGQLPCQTTLNLRGNVSAIALRSGKQINGPVQHIIPNSTIDSAANSSSAANLDAVADSVANDPTTAKQKTRSNQQLTENSIHQKSEHSQKSTSNIPLLFPNRMI